MKCDICFKDEMFMGGKCDVCISYIHNILHADTLEQSEKVFKEIVRRLK
jgi:hypothetical protein